MYFNNQKSKSVAEFFKSLRWICLLILFLVSGAFAQSGSYNWDDANDLYPAIKHVRIKMKAPRLLNINCLRIDSYAKGLKFYTTPAYSPWVADVSETQRKTTRNFIRESQKTDRKIVAAINADFFSPWPAPWNQETITNLLGLAVSEGSLVSPGADRPSFIVSKNGSVSLAATSAAHDISNIQTAVSGSGFVLQDGKFITGSPDLHPRTAIGIDESKRYVYFMIIDGRRLSSGGATEQEVGVWLKYFGAYNGINMDGGGSATMAWWNPDKKGADKAVLLNLPGGSGKMPDKEVYERANGNNIGVYFTELPNQED